MGTCPTSVLSQDFFGGLLVARELLDRTESLGLYMADSRHSLLCWMRAAFRSQEPSVPLVHIAIREPDALASFFIQDKTNK